MPIKYYTSHLKNVVDDHHIDYRTRGRLPETYDVTWVDKRHPCKTGCWKFNHATGRHEIRLSVVAYPTIAKGGPAEGKRIAVPDLYRNVYEHEAAHSLYTDKDLIGLGKELAARKIPWRLMNLFEDCRIERLWIRNERSFKQFGWKRWEPHGDPDKTSATGLLFALKNEGLTPGGRLPMAVVRHFGRHKYLFKVIRYFRDILRAPDTKSLIPILERWLKEFPATGDDTIGEEGGDGTGDLGEAIGEASGVKPSDVKAKDPKGNGASPDKAKSEESKSESKSESSGDGEDNDGKPSEESTRAATSETATHGKGTAGKASAVIPTEDDETRYARLLATLMASAFRKSGVTAKGPTSTATRKLNMRGIIRRDWLRPFIGKVFGNTSKPHIPIIVDCSGSMGVETFVDRECKVRKRTDDCARILVRAFNELARRGLVTCTVYCSSAGGCHARAVLPVCEADISGPRSKIRIEAFSGSEGIGKTLRPMTKDGLYNYEHPKTTGSFFNEIVANSKVAIVYTDGDITDAPVNRAPLHARGLYTVGVYAGVYDATEELRRHFDYAVSRNSLWSVADALVRTMKTIPTK